MNKIINFNIHASEYRAIYDNENVFVVNEAITKEDIEKAILEFVIKERLPLRKVDSPHLTK